MTMSLGAGIGPKEKTLIIMELEGHNWGLSYSSHRNTVFSGFDRRALLYLQEALPSAGATTLCWLARLCNATPSTGRAHSKGFTTLQRAFGTDPSVNEASFTSEESWNNNPTVYFYIITFLEKYPYIGHPYNWNQPMALMSGISLNDSWNVVNFIFKKQTIDCIMF